VLETSILSWGVRREPGAVGKIGWNARGSTTATTAFLEPAALEPAALEPAAPAPAALEPAAPAAPAVVAAWSVRYTTEDDEVVKKSLAQVGVAYYYNVETSVAQWTCPEGFTPAETAASAASARS
jgi:hypothetical protein